MQEFLRKKLKKVYKNLFVYSMRKPYKRFYDEIIDINYILYTNHIILLYLTHIIEKRGEMTMYKEIILSVIKTSLPLMIVLILLQYIFRKHSTYILIEFSIAYSCVRMLPLINSMNMLGVKWIITLLICFLFLNTSTLLMYRIHSLNL